MENSSRYAFPLDWFLADRYQQLNDEVMPRELFRQQTVADYVLSKSLIFASITLKEDEFQLYQRLFHIIICTCLPDLLVYLHKDVPKLKENIRNRGRDYEQNIRTITWAIWKRATGTFQAAGSLRIVVLNTNEVDLCII